MSLRTRGHAAATQVVRRAIDAERAPHALLLVGPRGVGKTTLAEDLAAGLLCLDPAPSVRPCRACRACRTVDHGDHPDVHRVAPDGAGEQIRIAQVQALTSELALLPLEGRVRIAIIEAAHRLNPDAQNALLKTLEEPGPATTIVLCADDAAVLLPTVLSRSVRLRLSRLPLALVTELLVEAGLEPARARALAVAADGRPGLALTLARDPDVVLERVRLTRSLLDLGRAPTRARLAAAVDLVAAGARLAAASRGEAVAGPRDARPAERRRAVLAVLDTWREVSRDLAVVAWTAGPGIRDADLLEEVRAAVTGLDRAALLAFLERLDAMAPAVEAYANPELVLDTLLLAWPRPAAPAA